jgi:20S proteasome subunit beta 4
MLMLVPSYAGTLLILVCALRVQTYTLDPHKVAACAGPHADRVMFMEYIQRNMSLYEYRTGLQLDMESAASYVRTELAEALRSNPYQVNILLGGVDKDGKSSLYFMDYIGSCAKVNYGAHGYAGYFLLATLDRYWKENMTKQQVIDLANKCVGELYTRFLLNQQNFRFKIVETTGITEVMAADINKKTSSVSAVTDFGSSAATLPVPGAQA